MSRNYAAHVTGLARKGKGARQEATHKEGNMLHFISRFADWLQKTVFKGAALPGWMKKEHALWRFIYMIAIWVSFGSAFSCVIEVGFPPDEAGKAIMVGYMFGLFATVGTFIAHERLRREWPNRHLRIFFYSTAGTTEWVFATKFQGPAREVDTQLGTLLFALPVSRLFGKEEWSAFDRPEGIRLKLREDARMKEAGGVGWWIDVQIKGAGHLYIGEEGMQSGDVRVLAALRQIRRKYSSWAHFGLGGLLLWFVPEQEREARSIFSWEVEQWLKVLRASKKAAGSAELKALADRMEHVLRQLQTVTLEPIVDEGAPALILPPPAKERRRSTPAEASK